MSAYHLWTLVIINSVIFILFAFSFTRPKTALDWRAFGAFSAFVIALFTEMYGFPLTIYLLSGWLGNKYPGLNLYSHASGHLWSTLLGLKGDPHGSFLHVLSSILIFGGFLLLASAWSLLYNAQKKHVLATSGVYSIIRHPQYVAFVLVMIGFLLQWPTLPTLIMFPILLVVYVRLAGQEEEKIKQEFGKDYLEYAKKVPAFIPRLPS